MVNAQSGMSIKEASFQNNDFWKLQNRCMLYFHITGNCTILEMQIKEEGVQPVQTHLYFGLLKTPFQKSWI